MASPNPVPPLPPVMPCPPRRSLAGPVVLIILGVVFLLTTSGSIPPSLLGQLFARYWPVLIILWGLIKLLEYYSARSQGYAARGIGAGGVVLLCFIILIGLAATSATRMNWHGVGDEIQIDDNFIGLFGNRYEFTDQQEQPFPANATLQVVCERGNIKVTPGADDKLRLAVHNIVIARSQDEANRIHSDTKPRITVEGSVVRIDAGRSQGGTTHLDIVLPRKGALELTTQRGAIEVRGREGDLKADTSRGDVTLEDLTGNATVHLRHGDIVARRISGDASFEGRVGDTTIDNVNGSVSLRGDFFGEMNLSKIAKSVTFKSSRTDLEFARLDGDMRMATGDLRAKSIAGPVRLITRSKDIHLEDVSGDVRVEDSNAEVSVYAGQLPLGNIAIDNRKGTIQVMLPARAAFQVNGRATRGEIRSEFGELKVDTVDHDARVSGAVGGGGAQVQLNTERGDIEIRKAG